MTLTPKARPSTSLTVSEMPSSATEPLGAMKRARSGGTWKRKRRESPSGSIATISASPSTWPETMCPPSSSPSFSGRSRLTREPGRQPQRGAMSVSAEASTTNQPRPSLWRPVSMAVRHTPEQAMEAPIAMVGIIAAGDGDARVAARLDGKHFADVADDAGEHDLRSFRSFARSRQSGTA
jgi:hypothetical protein